jgi:uncharacterized protein (TIGR02466 family)
LSPDSSVAARTGVPGVLGPSLQGVSFEHLFPIPFATKLWTENVVLNEELKAGIRAESERDSGERRSKRSGHLEFLGEPGRFLRRQMQLLADEATRRVLAEVNAPWRTLEWSFVAWANISAAGNGHSAHTHPGATWSGVYYVDAGDADHGKSGLLELSDPCLSRANGFLPHVLPSSIRIHPRAGLMVLFPSFISHAVLPHGGVGARISIAFNFRKEPYP